MEYYEPWINFLGRFWRFYHVLSPNLSKVFDDDKFSEIIIILGTCCFVTLILVWYKQHCVLLPQVLIISIWLSEMKTMDLMVLNLYRLFIGRHFDRWSFIVILRFISIPGTKVKIVVFKGSQLGANSHRYPNNSNNDNSNSVLPLLCLKPAVFSIRKKKDYMSP